MSGEHDVVVFESVHGRVDEPSARRQIPSALRTLAARSDMADAVSPFGHEVKDQVSADRTAAIALLSVDGDLSAATSQIQDALDSATRGAGLHAYLVGNTPISDGVVDSEYESAEAVGVPIAFVIVLLATGAPVTSLLPIGLGIVAVTLAFGVLGGVGHLTTLDGILSSVVPMIGLAVGIDYALLVAGRFREELRSARDARRRPTRRAVEEAVGVAVASSGLTIAFSGVVVMLSLLSLVLSTREPSSSSRSACR